MWCGIASHFAIGYQNCFRLLSRSKKLTGAWRVSCQLRELWIGNRFILLFLIHIDVVKSQQIQKIHAIDHTQTEELLDVRFRGAIFQLCEPTVGNTESLVSF